jgi:hypothetical protein
VSRQLLGDHTPPRRPFAGSFTEERWLGEGHPNPGWQETVTRP